MNNPADSPPVATANTAAVLNSLKLGAVTGAVVAGSFLFRRSAWAQRRSVRRALQLQSGRVRGSPLHCAAAQLAPGASAFPRTQQLRALRSVIGSEPSGPIVVSGPEGAGLSSLVRAACAQAPMALHVNLRERAAGERFLLQIVRASGFYIPPEELLQLGMLKREGGRVSAWDTERCLRTITDVLRREAEAGAARADARANAHSNANARTWMVGSGAAVASRGAGAVQPRVRLPPRPVVVIDEMHSSLINTSGSGSGSGSGGGGEGGEGSSDDAHDLAKFLRWALFLTDSNLAQVVLVARPDVALSLDSIMAFQSRRRRFVVGFVPEAAALSFLLSVSVDAAAAAEAAGRGGGPHEGDRGQEASPVVFSREDAAMVSRTIGGNMKELALIVDAVYAELDQVGHANAPSFGAGKTGAGTAATAVATNAGETSRPPQLWRHLHSNMMLDAEDQVARMFEALLDEGNDPSLTQGARIAAFKRGLRFWAMLELLSQGPVARRDLAASVFKATGGASAKEIEMYLEAGLLTYSLGTDTMTGVAGAAGDGLGLASQAGGLWISAASPRLQAAFASFVRDPRMAAYRERAEVEKLKQEHLKREGELARRRLEQAADQEALARTWMAAGGEDSEQQRELLTATLDTLRAEQQRTVRELTTVRELYDNMKWGDAKFEQWRK